MKEKKLVLGFGAVLFILFLIISYLGNLTFGKEIGNNFMSFSIDMMKFLPFVFILIGLFEVWVKRETVEKHFGEGAGIKSYIWAVLLGSTTVGAVIVTLPVAYTLHGKGARLGVVFAYVGSAAVCRIPMTIFEASYLGVEFTILRYAVSVPLIIILSSLLGRYLEKRDYSIKEGER